MMFSCMFFVSSRRRHTRCALVTGVQTCALPILDDDDFLDELADLDGGPEAREAIEAYLSRYGMRGAGELDITRPRWSEQPSVLVPLILANVKSFQEGEAARRFHQGRRAAPGMEKDLLESPLALPDGERNAEAEKRLLDQPRPITRHSTPEERR